MGKKILTFGNIEIDNKYNKINNKIYRTITHIFLGDVDIGKLLI